jgi:transducin (beta)-like 1
MNGLCRTIDLTTKIISHRASFDHTVKLWDVTTGKCIHDLSNFHSEAVYSISFSPDGRYLASGSFDSQIAVWNVSDGSLVRTYKGGAGNFEVHWNPAGDRLVACFGDNKVPSNIVCYPFQKKF